METMDGQLYFLSVTVLLLFALALTLPVLRDIVREGLDRRQQRSIEEIESDGDAGAERNGPSTTEDTGESGSQRCSHCGATNDAEYTFCQKCSEPL